MRRESQLGRQTQPQKAPRMATAERGREGIGEFSARRADLDNRATPALGEARQKRETSPRFPRPEANDGSAVGGGVVARTIPPAGDPKREGGAMPKKGIPRWPPPPPR